MGSLCCFHTHSSITPHRSAPKSKTAQVMSSFGAKCIRPCLDAALTRHFLLTISIAPYPQTLTCFPHCKRGLWGASEAVPGAAFPSGSLPLSMMASHRGAVPGSTPGPHEGRTAHNHAIAMQFELVTCRRRGVDSFEAPSTLKSERSVPEPRILSNRGCCLIPNFKDCTCVQTIEYGTQKIHSHTAFSHSLLAGSLVSDRATTIGSLAPWQLPWACQCLPGRRELLTWCHESARLGVGAKLITVRRMQAISMSPMAAYNRSPWPARPCRAERWMTI